MKNTIRPTALSIAEASKRAAYYLKAGQPKDAERLYRAIAKGMPNNPEANYNLGVVLQQLGRLDEALVSYDRAVALKPDFAEAYCNRGNVLKDLKRLDEALASYDRAVALKPDFAKAYCNRGIVLRDLKRLDEALVSHDRAVALKPDFAKAYCNRGIVLLELKRLDEALVSYDRTMMLTANGPKTGHMPGTEVGKVRDLAFTGLLWTLFDQSNHERLGKVFRQYVAEFCSEQDSEYDDQYLDGVRITGTNSIPLGRRDRFRSLLRLLENTLDLAGLVAECGCYRGLSSFLICNRLKRHDATFDGTGYQIFDSFEGLSVGGAEDLAQDTVETSQRPREEIMKAGHFTASLDKVRQALAEFPGIECFPGWIPTAFPSTGENRYRFVHVDVDLYQPTKDSFEYFWPRMVPGGLIVCDDYNWAGGERAVKEFCQSAGVRFEVTPYNQAYFFRLVSSPPAKG